MTTINARLEVVDVILADEAAFELDLIGLVCVDHDDASKHTRQLLYNVFMPEGFTPHEGVVFKAGRIMLVEGVLSAVTVFTPADGRQVITLFIYPTSIG